MMKQFKFLGMVFSVLFLFIFHSFIYADGLKKQTSKQDSAIIKEKNIKVTFVELGSVNCIPCKAMQPVMNEIEQEYGDQVKVVFYDVWTDAGRVYGEKYNVRAIPTQVFLDKNGKEFFRHIGFFSKKDIVKVLEKQGVKKTKANQNNYREK